MNRPRDGLDAATKAVALCGGDDQPFRDPGNRKLDVNDCVGPKQEGQTLADDSPEAGFGGGQRIAASWVAVRR
jgi:hypothetical protein